MTNDEAIMIKNILADSSMGRIGDSKKMESAIDLLDKECKRLEGLNKVLSEMVENSHRIAETHARNMDQVLTEMDRTLTVRDRFLLAMVEGDFANPDEGRWMNETRDHSIDTRIAFYQRFVDRIMESRKASPAGREGDQA